MQVERTGGQIGEDTWFCRFTRADLEALVTDRVNKIVAELGDHGDIDVNNIEYDSFDSGEGGVFVQFSTYKNTAQR